MRRYGRYPWRRELRYISCRRTDASDTIRSRLSTDEKTQAFVTAYKDAYTDTPNQFAADAYDAVYAIKAAAEKEDVKADMDVADICAALEKGMTEITLEGVTGDEITWTEDGEPNKAPKAVEIKDGAYVAME